MSPSIPSLRKVFLFFSPSFLFFFFLFTSVTPFLFPKTTLPRKVSLFLLSRRKTTRRSKKKKEHVDRVSRSPSSTFGSSLTSFRSSLLSPLLFSFSRSTSLSSVFIFLLTSLYPQSLLLLHLFFFFFLFSVFFLSTTLTGISRLITERNFLLLSFSLSPSLFLSLSPFFSLVFRWLSPLECLTDETKDLQFSLSFFLHFFLFSPSMFSSFVVRTMAFLSVLPEPRDLFLFLLLLRSYLSFSFS
ncbi:hypothetical protein CSUI_008316 [Cystoisospora suis]|uniref:Transmembrane protein n=1 Tax=Cystoisospora suis TaxID=483139 RepID=A0A2C6KL56_9APIC|nr:hypothetical protein CSUI_008316 [Cystoisospora suis]